MVNIIENEKKIGCLGGELLLENNEYLVRIDNNKLPFNSNQEKPAILKEVLFLTTANLFSRRDILLEIGGFDPEYFYMWEDADICFRIRSLGFLIILDARTLVLHNYSQITRKSNFYLQFRNQIRCSIKNSGLGKGLIIEPIKILWLILQAFKTQVASGRKIKESIHIINLPQGRLKQAFLVILIPFRIIASLILGYLWNLLFLWKTLYSRKKNFIVLQNLKA